MTPRRELQVAVGLCLLGSLLVLWATGRTWVTFRGLEDLTIQGTVVEVAGDAVASGARALGVVGVAGVLALAATRRAGRVLVGVLLLAAGAGTLVLVVRALPDLDVRARQTLTSERPAGCVGESCAGQGRASSVSTSAWPYAALAGGVVLASGGALVAVRGRRWAGLGSSYDAPAASPPRPAGDKDVWDALDRGDDPTDGV